MSAFNPFDPRTWFARAERDTPSKAPPPPAKSPDITRPLAPTALPTDATDATNASGATDATDADPPDGQPALDADPDAVAHALDELLHTGALDDKLRVLKRQKKLLLTTTAQLLLMSNIAAARQPNDDPEQQAWADLLALHLELLRDARESTIAEAWSRFEATLRERGELAGTADNADFLTWLTTPDAREERRFLEAHPTLVTDPATEALIQTAIDRAQTMADEQLAALNPRLDLARKQPGPLPADLEQQVSAWRDLLTFIDDLRSRLALLDDIRRRASAYGGDFTSAIRDGYVNARGGFCLDLPPWLETTIARSEELQANGDPDQTAPARVALWRAALMQAQREQLAQEIIAAAQSSLWVALDDLRSGDTDAAQDEGISHLEAALRVYTLDRLPLHYATTQNNLGNVYRERLRGETAANQEAAITCFQEALRVRTLDRLPLHYAMTQNNLGNVYAERLRGETAANQEAAITCYQAALRVYTLDRLPLDYAMTQNNLGTVYRERLRGETAANQEAAITCFQEALRVRTLDRLPLHYAMTQNNLGNVYRERLRGETAANQEAAITCFQEALRVRTLDRLPLHYAMTQNNLGNVYAERLRGETAANQEAAITCYQAALRVYTLDRLPLDYATTQNNLGNVYRERLRGETAANQEAAITCFQEALRVRTLDRLPLLHRETQLNLAFAWAEWGRWALAHTAYQGALAAEELLLAQASGGLRSSDIISRGGRSAATGDGFALTHLDRSIEAALTVERGRARGLAETRLRASGDPTRIGDRDRRSRYQQALGAFNRAQKASNASITLDELVTLGGLDPTSLPQNPSARAAALESAQRAVELARGATLSATRAAFNAIVAEVRTANDPADFLLAPLDEATLWRAASVGEPGHALVYLIATPWGGAAIAAFTANPALQTTRRCLTLGLPALTDAMVNDLIQRMVPSDAGDGHPRLVAGFAWAQTGDGFERLLYDWPGATFREKALALRQGCAAASIAAETTTLLTAAEETLAMLAATPRYAATLDAPLATLPARDPAGLARLANVIDSAFLRAELRHSLRALADAALRPLAAWLNEQGATSVTLIPCGGLGTFPLLAAPVAPAGPGERSERVFADAFSKGASIAPSARALLRGTSDRRTESGGVIALGDPETTHRPLKWGEAEAITFASLARKAGLPAESHTRSNARRGWLLHALRTAWVADLSCHGVFDASSPLDSELLLALDKTLSLRDLLSLGLAEGTDAGTEAGQPRQTDLRGMRLLILSACQTAILDLRGAREEARSLAAGILEAGAEAALASLWSVDDKATYLLMVKFAQLWFPNREVLAPAAALMLAQRWLRNVTNGELRRWRYDTLAPITAAERKAASDDDQGSDPWESEDQQQAAYASALAQAAAVLAQPQGASGADQETLGVSRLRGLRPRGERYGVKKAEEQIHVAASNARDDDECPFADPFYWAGFQMTGW